MTTTNAQSNNHLKLTGVLARDPELRFTPTGTAIFEATIAGEDHIVGHDGQHRKLPWYHRVTILGKPAEWQAEKNLKGGDAVSVDGSVDYSSWDDANGGGKRSMVKVKAQRLEQLARTAEVIQDAAGGVRMDGGMNVVNVRGNVVRDPELRYTPAGDAVLGLSLAVNESWNDRQGQKQEKTHWIDVTLWRELAEAHKELKKGEPVAVTGRLVNESWNDKDGNKRNTTKIEATVVEALVRGGGNNGGGGNGGSTSRPQTSRPQTQQRPPASPQGAGQRSGGLDIDQGFDDFPPEEENLPF